eukprot:2827115-Amphidinium_carterae.1
MICFLPAAPADQWATQRKWPQPYWQSATVGRWQSSASLMKVVASLDSRIQENHDPAKHGDSKVHWLLLLDFAPVHCSAETLRASLPWVHACFALPQSTSVCQPADVAYMRLLKAAITRSCARYFADVLMDGKLEHVPLAELRALLQLWCGAALTQVQSMLHEEPADDALAAAIRLHENGNLFIKAAEVLVEKGPDFDL